MYSISIVMSVYMRLVTVFSQKQLFRCKAHCFKSPQLWPAFFHRLASLRSWHHFFFQKVKEDVKQQKDEAKWINEIVSLMVDGWFLFVCLFVRPYVYFLQMGHIALWTCYGFDMFFIQTNVSCLFFFRRGAVRLYKRCCCRFNISSCSINIRFTKQDETCKNSASNHQMQALQRQK